MKFHERAIAIFGLKQNKEGASVIRQQFTGVGTITATNRAKVVFKNLAFNETITIQGLVFTCTDVDGITSGELATNFSNLADGTTAAAANSSNSPVKGTFTSGTLAGVNTLFLQTGTILASPTVPSVAALTLTFSSTGTLPTVTYSTRYITGISTFFQNGNYLPGLVLQTSSNVVIGKISTVISSTIILVDAAIDTARDNIAFLVSNTVGTLNISNRQEVVFKALTNGQTVVIGGTTYTASGSVTSTVVAAYFITNPPSGYTSILRPNINGSNRVIFSPTTASLADFTLANSGTGGVTSATYRKDIIIGTGTKFKYETVDGDSGGHLTKGAYIYIDAVNVGRVKKIENQTFAFLETDTLGAVAHQTKAYEVGLGAKNTLAVLNLNYSSEFSTESFQYTGNELSRDEQTNVTDKYAQATFETFIPRLGVIANSDPDVEDVPFSDFWEAAGFGVVLSSDGAGTVKFTNGVASNAFMTLEIRRSSQESSTIQKVFTISDARGSLDLDCTIGTKGKLNWSFMGNLQTVQDKPYITADPTVLLNQSSNVAANVKSTTIITSQLSVYTTLSAPTYVDATKNVCFNKLNAPNLAGFSYSRYLTGCGDGWSKGAVASDVTLTIQENEAGAVYNPDDNVEKNHALYLKYAPNSAQNSGAVQISFNKLQLMRPTNSTVAEYAGQDLSFRNTGITELTLYASV